MGKPLKGESQECFRHEIRSERSREEQSVRRSNEKPEDAAKSGEANPMIVASRYQKALKGNKPQESQLIKGGAFREKL